MGPPEPEGLILTDRCRDLRRALTPMAWMVLEEVLLDALDHGNRIIATTSARRVAAQLDIDAGTAASALRLLRKRRLLELERCSGPAGRFGLSSYVVLGTPGIRLLPPCGDRPQRRGHVRRDHTGRNPVLATTAAALLPAARTAEADGQATFGLDW